MFASKIFKTDKEKQIDDLTKENDFLKWYCEELEAHLPKELLKQVKEFYKKNVKKLESEQ